MKKEKQNGITLISLVITIIVLLILAGISIIALTGENGLLSRAKQAKENTLEAQKSENELINNYRKTVESYVSSNRDENNWNAIYSGNIQELLNADISSYKEIRIALVTSQDEKQFLGWNYFNVNDIASFIRILTFKNVNYYVNVECSISNNKISYDANASTSAGWNMSSYHIKIEGKN